MDILVIGIAGGTGSGKTTLMNNIISRFENDVTDSALRLKRFALELK